MMQWRDGSPCVVSGDSGSLRILPLEQEKKEPLIEEDWLQEALHEAPALLPIRKIDARAHPPLWSLGREVRVELGETNGRIDNLLLSSNGQLVLIEMKLWRNPEARRKVVSQVLDYAAHLQRWTYSDLDRIAREHGGSRGKSLFEWLAPDDRQGEH